MQTQLRVEGLHCANCARGLHKYLEKQGLEQVRVDFASCEVEFNQVQGSPDLDSIEAGITQMGYRVVRAETPKSWWTLERKLLIAGIFTFPLMILHLGMAVGLNPIPALHNPYVQLALSTPAILIGLWHFGLSAYKGLRHGQINMDVLIFIGGTAAFIYSMIGLWMQNPDYYFFETSAMIFTLVLLGNWMEHRAVKRTTTSIDALKGLQPAEAKWIGPDGTTSTRALEEVQVGDLVRVNEGDAIPLDGQVISGQGYVNESLLTGESEAISKKLGDPVVGASILTSGQMDIQITATGKNTVLSKMIDLVKSAQHQKPRIQRLADQISGIFVPVVLGLSILTLLLNYFAFGIPFGESMLRAIAVLVISCPCAMGLATPTAITVGVGRMAQNGILVRGGDTLEVFAQIRQIVLDKTGTLTSGKFNIQDIRYHNGISDQVKSIVYTMEQHSSHPIAQSLTQILRDEKVSTYPLKNIQEAKGLGMKAVGSDGSVFQFGSSKLLTPEQASQHQEGQLFLLKDKELVASFEIGDGLRTEAKEVVDYLKSEDLKPILLSGDQEEKTKAIAQKLGINQWMAQQSPEEKLAQISELTDQQPTAMVGDGINDAAALSRASLGISLSDASQVAMQSAGVILLDGQIKSLPKAHRISKLTLQTIKENLFWAFSYNAVAIPLAALGFLNPMWAALFMAFSDVVVIGNSLRLKVRR